MRPITAIQSTTLVLPQENIDTDQIIPARFLTTTERTGLGRAVFYDWRYDGDGKERPESLLNQADSRQHAILVAGRNFGCGSSREHAPWALLDYGFQAVISTEIADIFRNNSLKNGLLPVVVAEDVGAWLLAHPGAEVTVDLADCVVRLPDGRTAPFPVEPFARYCLLNGVDELGHLLAQAPKIEAWERQHA